MMMMVRKEKEGGGKSGIVWSQWRVHKLHGQC
jgi:hypothetical protein